MCDFTVDTTMRCFLCSDRILPQYQLKKQEYGSPVKEAPSLHSLQSLSHYLQIDMKFTEEEDVPHQLLTKVESANLKVELCEECNCLNEMFSKLYQNLTNIEMEVGSCLRRIHCKLMRATKSEDNSNENALNLGDSCDNESDGQLLEGKREIASLLRYEMIHKCSSKIADVLPTAKLQMTMNQVNTARMRLSTPLQHEVEPPEDDLSDEEEHTGRTYLEYEHDPERTEDEESNCMNQTKVANYANVALPLQIINQTGLPSVIMNNPACKERLAAAHEDKNPQIKISRRNLLNRNCVFCCKDFARRETLFDHLRLHAHEKPYLCKLCGESCTSRQSLKSHLNKHHSSARSAVQCTICKTVLASARNMREHMATHTKEKLYECRKCPAKFAHSNNFQAHLRMHNGDFDCSMCKKRLTRREYLRRHYLKVHNVINSV